MLNHELIETYLLIFMLSLVRMLSAFTIMPLLSKNLLGGAMLRNGVAMSLTIFIFPLVEPGYYIQEWSNWDLFMIVLKETFIGIMIGYCISLIFWSVDAVGFFIDNQRGAAMASTLNPLSGEQTSPMGIFLSQTVNTVFFSTGGFLIFLSGLYTSFQAWPLFEFYPELNPGMVDFFLGMLDLLMFFTAVLAAPIILAMFFAEFGLALVGRFAPQLDVFFLAMPIKSAISVAIMTVYLTFLVYYFNRNLHLIDEIFARIGSFI